MELNNDSPLHYIFDIETNDINASERVIHSLVILCVETGEMWSCCDEENYTSLRGAKRLTLAAGIRLLDDVVKIGDIIIGHNIIKFDTKEIYKVYPVGPWPITQVRDTLTISRLIWPEIKTQVDFGLFKKGVQLGPLMGRHNLEAWGLRLRFPKDDYSDRMVSRGLDPWAAWNPLMQDYCERDVEVTAKLWEVIQKKNYSETAIALEQEFQEAVYWQEKEGIPFDIKEAHKLVAKLSGRREELRRELIGRYPPWYKPGKEFIPKADNKRFGYVKNAPMTTLVLEEFNPGSRRHLAHVLIKTRQWKPEVFTETEQPEVSDDVLTKLAKSGWDECALMAEYLLVEKRLGQISEGKNAWLVMVQPDGHIHGQVITNGAVTGRCTHMKPNLAQTPRVGSPYGQECRALFHAPPGWKMVGADAAGLELRMLAHYMGLYDGGEYAKVVVEGDVHTLNQQAAGLPTRNDAKTFIYAFLYGAGPQKLGSIVHPTADEKVQVTAGKKLTRAFLKKTPALKKLKEKVAAKAETPGYLIGLDGRRLHIRSQHAALNTLLQSAGSLCVKYATTLLRPRLEERGLIYGRDWVMVLHIHDEFQLMVRDDERVLKLAGETSVQCIKDAGVFFNLRVPLDGEYKIGSNWAETH